MIMGAVVTELRTLLGALVDPSPGSSYPNPPVDAYVTVILTVALFMFNWVVRLFVVLPFARVNASV